MKLINEKGRLFGIINPVDLLFIIVVAAAVIFAVGKVLGGDKGSAKVNVYFTVEFNDVDPEIGKMIQVGDEIRDSIKGHYLGVVDDFSVEPYKMLSFDFTNNTFVWSEVPGKERVLIRIRAKGSETDTNIYAEDQTVKVGQKMSIKGRGYANTGYIVDLYIKEGGL